MNVMPSPVTGAQWPKRQLAVTLNSIDQLVERYPQQIMAAILLIYLGRAVFFSRGTELQTDELLTFAAVQLPSLSKLWWTLKHYPPALDPPLYPVLAYLSLRLPISFPLSYRIPSIIGYGALMLSLFTLLRRRFPASVALTASVIPMIVPAFFFAIQARPYGMLLGFSGWSLVFWQRATESSNRRIGALTGMYLCLVGVLLSHFLGGLIYIPLIAAELWRSFRNGIDSAIWMVFALSATTILTYIPLLPAASQYRISPWHGVIIDDLWQTYLLGVGPIAIILISLCAFWWLSYRSSSPEETTIPMRQHECIAIAGLYAIPVISYLVARFVTHSYVARYALMFGIAEAIALAIIIYRMTNRALSSVVLLILIVFAGNPALKEVIERPGQNTGGISRSNVSLLDALPPVPIFEPSWIEYMKLSLFGPDNLKRRMVLVLDPEDVKQQTNFALSTEAVQRAFNYPEESYEQMIRSHPQFLLLESSRLRDELVSGGSEVRLVGRVLDRDLYLVKSPEGK